MSDNNNKIKGRLFIGFILFLVILAFATGMNYTSTQCVGIFQKNVHIWDSISNKCIKVDYVQE